MGVLISGYIIERQRCMSPCGDMHQSFAESRTPVKRFFDSFLMFADSFQAVDPVGGYTTEFVMHGTTPLGMQASVFGACLKPG